MHLIFTAVKRVGGPGSPGFLLAGALLCLALTYFVRTRRLGRGLLFLLVASYLSLSIPAVAHSIASRAGSPGVEPIGTGTYDQVFVLAGDNQLARAKAGVQLIAAARPRKVWILGGNQLRARMIDAGYPASAVPDVEGRPGNPPSWNASATTTREQMQLVGKLMRETHARNAAVVVSRLQAMRTRGLAKQLGLDVTVVPAPLDREPPASGVRRWLPNLSALMLSRDALYEVAAFAYYRRNGWV